MDQDANSLRARVRMQVAGRIRDLRAAGEAGRLAQTRLDLQDQFEASLPFEQADSERTRAIEIWRQEVDAIIEQEGIGAPPPRVVIVHSGSNVFVQFVRGFLSIVCGCIVLFILWGLNRDISGQGQAGAPLFYVVMVTVLLASAWGAYALWPKSPKTEIAGDL